MKQAIWILLLLVSDVVNGQQYGVQWVIGDRESVLDFRNDTLTNYSIGPEMPMFLTSANICDSSGNLLYYTNGIYIAGSDGNMITNGDTLSPCPTEYQQRCCGLDIPQGALFLPMPGNTRYYYLFHMAEDTFNGNRPGTLYYSIIDQQGNAGLGEVIQKNVPYFNGTIFREGGMTACKHANGRDWWIVMANEQNTYYKFLLTTNGIFDTLIQTIGPSYYNYIDIACSKFSQDGSKYVTSCNEGPVLIMNFDRCSGEFSDPVTLFNQACNQGASCSGASSVEFSANGRFLYAGAAITLNQYDLLDTNIQHDSTLLYQADSNDIARLAFLQLAPNGKIYGSCFNGGFYFIHAVNYPDLKGDGAEYIDTAFTTLTVNSANLPNMINYQLGPLIGSGCDTITTSIQNVANKNPMRILPNPADKYLYVEMGRQGDYEFDLLNELGQIVGRRETRQVDNFDTENLASGVYFVQVIDKNNSQNMATRKFVIQH